MYAVHWLQLYTYMYVYQYVFYQFMYLNRDTCIYTPGHMHICTIGDNIYAYLVFSNTYCVLQFFTKCIQLCQHTSKLSLRWISYVDDVIFSSQFVPIHLHDICRGNAMPRLLLGARREWRGKGNYDLVTRQYIYS